MPDNDIMNLDLTSIDDFELPPLPVRPVGLKPGGELDAAPAAENIDSKLPVLPEKTVDNSLDAITDMPSDDNLPAAAKEAAQDKVDELEVDDDMDLPPLKPIPVKKEEEEKEDEEVFAFEDNKAEEKAAEAAKDAETFDFEDDYDDLDSINPDNLVLEEMTRVSPIRSSREESARNMKEKIRMNDLASDVGNMPVLDDLSDEYGAPEKKAVDLVEREKLDADEKKILKQRLEEDLGKRPENFNARASQHMYNKLMEEKKLKTAKKGFVITLIPILLGLASAFLAFTQLAWPSFKWLNYTALFMALGALLLFIKSKHVKMLSVTLYAICMLLYVGPGLVMYVMDPQMQQAPDKILHIVFAILATACNMISIMILTKNESVHTYYNSDFKRK